MTAYRVTWWRLIPAAILATTAGVVAWADVLDHAPVDPANIEEGHPTGHLHDHADQVWPPQPRRIRNVTLLGNPGAIERAVELRVRHRAELERIALGKASVRKALGRRYTRPEVIEADGKGVVEPGTARLIFFSHENNTTVEVSLRNSLVRDVRITPPTDYQPAETAEEVVEAEGIARAYFNERGTARVGALVAYGIQAYLPQGKGFYPVRVIYVSFHESVDAPPEYAAWVDLSNRRVLRIREEQS